MKSSKLDKNWLHEIDWIEWNHISLKNWTDAGDPGLDILWKQMN